MSNLVDFEKSADGIGIITLNNPGTLNAMDEAMAAAFKVMVSNIEKESLRVLILTGSGKAFSAGGDLEMLLAKTKLSKEENTKKMLDFYDSFLCMRNLGVPIIAAVNGHAIGAGFCLALAADIRVISNTAKCGLTFTKLGLHPGMAATYFLPRVAGFSAAFELLLTGRIITGEDLKNFGLSNNICSETETLSKAMEVAKEITATGPKVTAQLLKTLRNPASDLIAALRHEADCQAVNYSSSEFLEGVTAVKEKRKASF